MEISLNVNTLLSNNLSIDEYVYLKNLHAKPDDKIDNIYTIISNINEDALQSKGFIKITEDGIIVRQKTVDLFESKELFYKFLTVFPIKAPSGRYLSPAGTEGKAVTTLKKKWNSCFKGKEHLQQKAIDVLEHELAWRKKSGNMEYIHAAEAWLNGADYEKYEYLLDDKKKESTQSKWM